LYSDADAKFDQVYSYEASDIEPMITYGTNPGMGIKVSSHVPKLSEIEDSNKATFSKAIEYMGLTEGDSLLGKQVNYVFIGSCTNSRIEDLRQVAHFLKGKKKAANVNAYIVPGSKQVEKQAIAEGIDKIFAEAGFELREPGCSACLGMNEDKIPKGEYCVSTSNRNFEGRQGPGARTLLASPLTAAAVAVSGKIVDVREFSLN
jgi:3-isopropylmalate/(R)-2-methylmalate dehydratase large subunit